MEEIAKVFGLNWKLLLVQIVNFGVLLAVLWYFLYNPILAMLDERRKKIEEGVQNAEDAGKRLGEIEGERKTILKDATLSAGDILSTSKGRAEEQAKSIVDDATSKAGSIAESAAKRADEAREQALRESREEIGRSAILAAEKIMRKG
ncbi:ATP synthase F0 subunit B [Candidatus Kaiserbacteria bacterium]|nr:MAG: ATP synthase F0 subunit B [Candidatus Kaiserbacteria bacterium]